ncbi:hypothetical protein ThidrDRAFT_2277 [Thiorhodococcus drewsii AZ1]|uniref:Alpha/beta hydrolase n=1 Tax=Thiorhodococcus drewsii AZ1 TaxID=765913 RepID=G2E1W4_9GAMM|nr:alpha/beta hydrolase [Thiorhodococcus drewsii]EGV31172.1 hypothetical protein ThidrDRAFT_2277 [Thiorhodococcus drewsii AZ1]
MPPARSVARPLIVLLVCCLIGGCSLSAVGSRQLDLLVSDYGMRRLLVEGEGYWHLVLLRGDPLSAPVVHIYLEGDGLPWSGPRRISLDPGPRDPLALRLMVQDPTPSIYLGRPCYHGLAESAGCSPWMWTFGRYSPQVVGSMTAALRRLWPPKDRPRLTLIGYSGGGVIGFLMAERLTEVERLVTLAANLDVDAWSEAHGYSRLEGSLNPALRAPLPGSIAQIHLLGDRDAIVPPVTISRFRSANPRAEYLRVRGYDHRCCWSEGWKGILAGMRRRSPSVGSVELPAHAGIDPVVHPVPFVEHGVVVHEGGDAAREDGREP